MRKKRLAQEEVFALICDHFPSSEFTTEAIRGILPIAASVNYFIKRLEDSKRLRKIARNRWVVVAGPIPEGGFSSGVLQISLKERDILQAIFNMDLKSQGGKSRFSLGNLKKSLSTDQQILLPELLPKLKRFGILSCLGEGRDKEKIIEVDDSLFLRYLSGENIEITFLSNTEIEGKINDFLQKTGETQALRRELSAKISDAESEIQKIEEQISALQVKKQGLEKALEVLRSDEHQNLDDDYPVALTDILIKMPREKRTALIQKIICG